MFIFNDAKQTTEKENSSVQVQQKLKNTTTKCPFYKSHSIQYNNNNNTKHNNSLYLYSLSLSCLLIAESIDNKIRVLAAWDNHRG